MTTATSDQQLTEFAEYVYKEQKDEFVKGLANRIKESIETGMTQVENSESMDFDSFKKKFLKEHGLNGKI